MVQQKTLDKHHPRGTMISLKLRPIGVPYEFSNGDCWISAALRGRLIERGFRSLLSALPWGCCS
jgi:hypothetical protein